MNNVFSQFKMGQAKRTQIEDYYTPSRPIEKNQHLKGRDSEVKSILSNLSVNGRHCMVYGARGIGKSSLARSTVNEIFNHDIMDGEAYIVRCDTKTKFSDIVGKCAIAVGKSGAASKTETLCKSGVRINFLKFFTGELAAEEKVIIERDCITPRIAADILFDLKGVLLIDEFDTVSVEVKHAVAEFIKQLSDHNSDLKVILVGISTDGQTLVAGHPSVGRCLHEIELSELDDSFLKEIIDGGEIPLGINFNEKVKGEIIGVSNGFPYFTHLLAHECATMAFDRGISSITEEHYAQAINEAIDKAEGRLKRDYDSAASSARTDAYKNVMSAASHFGSSEFSVGVWLDKIYSMYGVKYSPQAMNTYIGRLVKSSIIYKVKNGIYKFIDPRMPSYIKLMNSK